MPKERFPEDTAKQEPPSAAELTLRANLRAHAERINKITTQKTLLRKYFVGEGKLVSFVDIADGSGLPVTVVMKALGSGSVVKSWKAPFDLDTENALSGYLKTKLGANDNTIKEFHDDFDGLRKAVEDFESHRYRVRGNQDSTGRAL